MKRTTKKFIFTALCLVFSLSAFCQKVDIQIRGSALVATVEVFKIEYVVNERPEKFTPPASFDGLDVIAGPTLSFDERVNAVNNNVSRTVTFMYTYVLRAPQAGKYTISPAAVTVQGTEYSYKPYPVEAIDTEDGTPGSGRPQQEQEQTRPGSSPQQELTNDDLFVRIVVDKTNVFKGEPVRVQFKLYTRVNLSDVQGSRLPAFNGFWTQETDVSNYPWQRESYRNRIYETKVIKEFLAFPQQSGSLQIDQLELNATAQIITQQQRPQTIFDELFGGGPTIREVRRRLVAAPVSITVKDLPGGAPESFGGAVGDFTVTSETPSGTISANSSATYLLRVTGSGNLPLISAPKLELPASFEQYNIKTTESLSRGAGGITGYRQFEYPFIARAEGEYNIAPVEFTYFNPATNRYVTLTGREMNVAVLPDSTSAGSRYAGGGIVSGVSKEDITILGEDIRFIKIGDPAFVRRGNFFVASPSYLVVLSLLPLIFVGLLIYLQKRIKEARNTAAVKGRKANRVALQRLKAAEGYMKSDNRRQFYDEMLRALWGYMSDKLNIPVAILTKENVREELVKREIPAELVQRYTDTITQCEYTQYSPAEPGQMQEIYRSSVEVISKLESKIKRKV